MIGRYHWFGERGKQAVDLARNVECVIVVGEPLELIGKRWVELHLDFHILPQILSIDNMEFIP